MVEKFAFDTLKRRELDAPRLTALGCYHTP
jgi:hypothetical protein